MSFGFSVGDVVAVSQLCFTVLKALNTVPSSKSQDKAVGELQGLQSLLLTLSDGLKPDGMGHLLSQEQPDGMGHVLSQEQFQGPLRNALSQIRRHILDLQDSLERFIRSRSRPLLVVYASRMEKDIEPLVDRISHDRHILMTLVSVATEANKQEILSTLRNLTIKSVKSSAEEDIRIQKWLARWDQVEQHRSLSEKHGEPTGDSILADTKYQEWLDSSNSFLWLSGIRTSGFPLIQ